MDQETVLNWFGMEDPTNQIIPQAFESGGTLNLKTFQPSPNVSLETFRIIAEGLWEKIQEGLTLADIENVVFFILFVRFIILTIRYNLKTSFLITCIGLFAGYFWYRHLIDLISTYRSVLLKLPFLHRLGMDAVQLRSMHRQMAFTDLKLGENVHWYQPGQMFYYAFTQGIVHLDPETGIRYYRDPLSMLISILPDSLKSKILPTYYEVYQILIPKLLELGGKFYAQFSGLASYAIITRLGKRYCPYLIRWHWTFLLLIALVEQILIYFIYRVHYFQSFVLIPQIKASVNYVDPSLILQMNLLNAVIACVVLSHIGFIIFGLFHAICGQYFYFPFLVENTELHVGPRPMNSIYSAGYTSWQDPNEQEKNLKLWYGWFGRGTKSQLSIPNSFFQRIRKLLKWFKKRFQS